MTVDDLSASSERERDALAFMQRGRKLRGFTPAQIRRVERRLMERQRPARRRAWLPRLAVLCLALLAGSALANVLDLARVPLLGSLLPAPKSTDDSRTRRARAPTSRPKVAPSTPEQTDPPPLPASPPKLPPAPEVPSLPLPSSPPALPLGMRSVSAHGSTSAPPRVATRTAESRDRSSPSGVEGAVTPAPTPAVNATAARHANLEPVPAPAPAPPPWTGVPSPRPEDPVLAESRSFSAAVGRWHMNHDPKAALEALDAHQRRFPGGRLFLESSLLRAEILLQLGREQEGLLLLDGVALDGLPRGRELRTVRGELRIKHGRCADGRRDLNDVLAKGASDSFARRAAHAISLCPL